MINPCREHYWVLSGCAFSLPVIVLFLLLPSSVSLLIIWKEGKNVWIEEGDFPTVTQLTKIRHCGQVPIPMPCCTVRRGLRDNVLIIEWPFFLLVEKWWRIQLNVATNQPSLRAAMSGCLLFDCRYKKSIATMSLNLCKLWRALCS